MTSKFNFVDENPLVNGQYNVYDTDYAHIRADISRILLSQRASIFTIDPMLDYEYWRSFNNITVEALREGIADTWFESTMCDLIAIDSIVDSAIRGKIGVEDYGISKDYGIGSRAFADSLAKALLCQSSVLLQLQNIKRNNIFVKFSFSAVVPHSALTSPLTKADVIRLQRPK